jgi:hypothetical protein
MWDCALEATIRFGVDGTESPPDNDGEERNPRPSSATLSCEDVVTSLRVSIRNPRRVEVYYSAKKRRERQQSARRPETDSAYIALFVSVEM